MNIGEHFQIKLSFSFKISVFLRDFTNETILYQNFIEAFRGVRRILQDSNIFVQTTATHGNTYRFRGHSVGSKNF